MRKTTVARRYAKALIEIGQETGTSKDVGRELRDISALFSSHTELTGLLLNPMYKLDARTGLIEKVCEGLRVSDVVRRFLVLLVKNRNIGMFQDICSAYYKIEDEIAGRIRAEVEAAIDMSEDLKAGIKDKLGRLTGKEVILAVEKNPQLLGGIVVRVGNVVLDGSIKTQLDRVKTRLKEGVA